MIIALAITVGLVQGLVFLPVMFRIGAVVETRFFEHSDGVRGAAWLALVVLWILACLLIPIAVVSPITAGALPPDAALDMGDLWLISLFGGMLLYTGGQKLIARRRPHVS